MPRIPAMPVVGRPRSSLAWRTRRTDARTSGAKQRATVTATAISWSTPGSDRSTSRGLASEFAAPNASSTTARRSPPLSAERSPSTVTGPPMLTPSAHEGIGSDGSETSTWPGTRWPKITWSTTRRTMTIAATRAKVPSGLGPPDRSASASVTTQSTPASKRSRSGLEVLSAAMASPADQSHQATAWGRRSRFTPCSDGGARARRPRAVPGGLRRRP